MDRRGFLKSLTGIGLASLLPFNALAKAAAKKRRWKAVLMVGVNEHGVLEMNFVNREMGDVAVTIQGLAILSAGIKPVDVSGVSKGVPGDEKVFSGYGGTWREFPMTGDLLEDPLPLPA